MSAEPSRHVMTGAGVGKYRLLMPVGHGGMADVYLALAQGPVGVHKLLVVKVLRPAFVHEPEFLEMFMDEARLAARLAHPNVVQTYEVGDDRGLQFIAMEFLEGQPLNRVVKRCRADGSLSLAMHLVILADVLAGLHHAHELIDFDGTPLQVVHRDVTPHNVFVTYDGQIKLVDFGIAKAMDSVAETRVGTFKGKLAYMSPEQARAERVDRRADVFAVGVMLWEAIAGRRMWQHTSEVEIARHLGEGRLPRLLDVVPDAPAALVDLVERALAPDPAERIATAQQMQSEIEQFLRSLDSRVDGRDVGQMLSQRFSSERIELRMSIDAQVRSILESERAGGERGNLSMPPLTVLETLRESSMAPPSSSSPDDVTKRHGPIRRGLRIEVVIVVVLVLAVGLWAWSTFRSPSPALENPVVGPGRPSDPPRRPLIELSGDIESDAVLLSSNDYLLKYTTFVRPNATLTIEAGTTIYGDKETQALLVVQPGGRLVADGRRDAPIVFTSEMPPGERRAGDWGGVLILGNAPTNLRDSEGRPRLGAVEGLTQGGEYGGQDPDDDSGVLRYVRIEYSGIEIGPNNEVNGLTLAGVGRSTVIEHVQVRNTQDDCFEFFGGTVDAKYLICQNAGDDGFDFDHGYQGRLQYLLMVEDPTVTDGSNGIEVDNDPSGSLSEPVTHPVIYNAALCGSNRRGEIEAYGVLVRRAARLTLVNAIVSGWDAGVDLRDRNTTFDIRASVFFGNLGANLAFDETVKGGAGPLRDDDFGVDERRLLLAPGKGNTQDDPGLPGCFDRSAPRFKPVDPRLEGSEVPPDDGFFDTRAAYAGAFRDEHDHWERGWARFED